MEERMKDIEEMIDGFDELSEKEKGHIIGTITTVLALNKMSKKQFALDV